MSEIVLPEIYTFAEFQKEVDELFAITSSTWRYGQTAFNVLRERRPDLSEKCRRTLVDPFYQDEKMDDFLTWVQGNWNG